jgi:hypothetical protein
MSCTPCCHGTGQPAHPSRSPATPLSGWINVGANRQLTTSPVIAVSLTPKRPRLCNVWFRPGECLRLIYDELREATQPVTTRELAERLMRVKAISVADNNRRELVQKTLLASLNRAKETIARVETGGVVSWRLI